MSNSFAFLENASNNDPNEIASKQKEVKAEPKVKVEEKKVVQQPRKQKPVASSEAVEEGFQATRTNARGGRQQHKGYQPPKKGRSFDHHVSGTGRVKGEQKKGGGGKGNWGKSTEGVAPKEEKPVEQAQETAGEQQAQPTEEKKEEVVAAPVDNSLTFEEYLAKKSSTKVQIKKESGAELVTGKNVKLVDAAFERPSDDLFQKEKKKVEQGEKKTEKKSDKPKTISASDFLDTAALEKIKQKRDRELENGPKREREPRVNSARPGNNKGPRNNNAKTGQQKSQKPSTAGAKKPRAPVLNKEKDFPALSPQN